MRRLSMALFVCFFLSSIAAIEISSKIDLDSEDTTSSDSSVNGSDPLVIVVENSNTEAQRENGGLRSSASRPRAGGNVSVRGPLKPIRSHSNYPINFRPARPKVTKNIYIVINGKTAGKPGNFNCIQDVCESTLSTDIDDQGNVVGSVRLTVVTRTGNPKDEDVPVVDGVRGTGNDDRRTFAFDNGRASPNPPFLDNNIPQAPRPGQQVPRRRPFRPQSASLYPRNFAPRRESPVWNPWVSRRGSVDDKIEAPLSQTNPGDQRM